MIEYVGESRIDGYPIVRVPKGNEGEEFLNYFRRKNVELNLIDPFEDNLLSESNYIRIRDFIIVKHYF